MEAGEAGPPKHSVTVLQLPRLSSEAQAPQWLPVAGREAATRAAPRRRISRLKAEEIRETWGQGWFQDKGNPAGCSGLQQNDKEPHDPS